MQPPTLAIIVGTKNKKNMKNLQNSNHDLLMEAQIILPSDEKQNESDFQKFKKRVLANQSKIKIDFEVGYAYKKKQECYYLSDYTYWEKCYFFLKSLAHYQGIETWR